MLISLEHVSKVIGQDSVLKELSVLFNEYKTTIIIGSSGCGKSTLLRLILGLTIPTTGKIYLDGQELNQANANSWRRQIGYVTQDGGLFPHLTVKSNVTLMASYLKLPQDWIEQRFDELCDLMRLPKNLFSHYPSELSGGQRQRVSLMRALMLDPKCLLLDEPLGALDPINRYELQIKLKEIFLKLNKTILLVTHDMQEAAYFGHEIFLMRAGSVVQRGSFQELTQQPAEPFVTSFINLQHFPSNHQEALG